jgi:hypothetical protein
MVPDGFNADDYFIEFDEENHRYFVDGKATKSVTGILDDGSYKSEAAQRGMAIGKAVHKLLEKYDNGEEIDIDNLDAEILPYIKAHERFCDICDYIPLFSEQIVYHPVHDYIGRLDRIALINSKLCLPDFKTGTSGITKTMGLQLAAYAACVPFNIIEEELNRVGFRYSGKLEINRKIIRLKPNGDFRIHDFDDPYDFHKFLKILKEQS